MAESNQLPLGNPNQSPPENVNRTPPESQSKAKQALPKDTKTYAYSCLEKCVYKGRFRREGDLIFLDKPGEKIPHFKEVKI
ncbi:MAG: hypothetical protein FWD78_02925 [Treponema sp.]|nr:hypothetical protein [Treponema sp.]